MKELTGALMKVGLASACFGARQMSNLLSANQKVQAENATETLNNVAATLIDQCGEPLRDTFDMADKVQREVMDTTLRAFAIGDVSNSDAIKGSWVGVMSYAMSRMGQVISRFTQGDDEAAEATRSSTESVPPEDDAPNAGVF